jgi:hypothetical protein
MSLIVWPRLLLPLPHLQTSLLSCSASVHLGLAGPACPFPLSRMSLPVEWNYPVSTRQGGRSTRSGSTRKRTDGSTRDEIIARRVRQRSHARRFNLHPESSRLLHPRGRQRRTGNRGSAQRSPISSCSVCSYRSLERMAGRCWAESGAMPSGVHSPRSLLNGVSHVHLFLLLAMRRAYARP